MAMQTALAPRHAPPLPPARISVPQYHAMIAAGILGEDDPVELIENQLVQTMPQGSRHAHVQEEIADRLRGVCGPGHHVRSEKPLTLSGSEPEPDAAVVRGDRADFTDRHPGGADCVLVVEVAASSLDLDLRKADVYAAAGVPAYWLVDLDGRRLIAHAGPTPAGYGSVEEVDRLSADLPGGVADFTAADIPE